MNGINEMIKSMVAIISIRFAIIFETLPFMAINPLLANEL